MYINPRSNMVPQLQVDPRTTPGPESPAWLTAMGDADLEAERHLRGETPTFPSDHRSKLEKLLISKSQYGDNSGFAPLWIPDWMFPFQQSLAEWSIVRGRGAELADCGLGKTIMQLVWELYT